MRVALLLIAGVAFCQQPAVKNPHTAPADIAAGAKAFRSHCAECHGYKGEGGRGPNLTTGVFFHGSTDADLFRNISDGIPGTAMPGFFSPVDQIWQTVAYVRSLSQTGSLKPPPGNAARGRQLFRSTGCLTCHLVRGEGGIQGPDLSVIGSQRSVEHLKEAILDPTAKIDREYRVAKITARDGAQYSGLLMNEDTYTVQLLDFSKGLKSVSRRDISQLKMEESSSMPSFKGRLSSAQLDDLVAYLWSLQRRSTE